MENKKIYVVEDMAVSRAALISILKKANFDVVGSAANAEMAFEDLKKQTIDLLLLDINLAGKKDGIWLAEQVRLHLNMPIVFLTAYGDEGTLKKLESLNPNGYLLKPYNKPTLITTVNIALKTFESMSIKTLQDSELFMIVDLGAKKVKISLNKILYLKSDGNYIEIHLKDITYVVRQKLSDFMNAMPKNDIIIQVHLRYVINTHFIAETSSKSIVINGIIIPVSDRFRENFESIKF